MSPYPSVGTGHDTREFFDSLRVNHGARPLLQRVVGAFLPRTAWDDLGRAERSIAGGFKTAKESRARDWLAIATRGHRLGNTPPFDPDGCRVLVVEGPE